MNKLEKCMHNHPPNDYEWDFLDPFMWDSKPIQSFLLLTLIDLCFRLFFHHWNILAMCFSLFFLHQSLQVMLASLHSELDIQTYLMKIQLPHRVSFFSFLSASFWPACVCMCTLTSACCVSLSRRFTLPASSPWPSGLTGLTQIKDLLYVIYFLFKCFVLKCRRKWSMLSFAAVLFLGSRSPYSTSYDGLMAAVASWGCFMQDGLQGSDLKVLIKEFLICCSWFWSRLCFCL